MQPPHIEKLHIKFLYFVCASDYMALCVWLMLAFVFFSVSRGMTWWRIMSWGRSSFTPSFVRSLFTITGTSWSWLADGCIRWGSITLRLSNTVRNEPTKSEKPMKHNETQTHTHKSKHEIACMRPSLRFRVLLTHMCKFEQYQIYRLNYYIIP